jgi:roadblock/LC7 domain-containing protein
VSHSEEADGAEEEGMADMSKKMCSDCKSACKSRASDYSELRKSWNC